LTAFTEAIYVQSGCQVFQLVPADIRPTGREGREVKGARTGPGGLASFVSTIQLASCSWDGSIAAAAAAAAAAVAPVSVMYRTTRSD